MLSPGYLLRGEYRILRVLAKGPVGAVYEVEARSDGGKHWAVKEMVPAMGVQSDVRRMASQFKQEADLLGKLHHPGLPAFIEAFRDRGNHYIVEELVEGQTVQQIVEREGIQTEERTLAVLRRVFEVLDYLHGRSPPVILRELKPAGIMLTARDEVKLMDLGYARLKEDDGGTRQFGGDITDERTDIHAVGAVGYYMLTRAQTALGVQRVAKQRPAAPLRDLNPNVSEATATLFEKMLASAASKRFQSVAEVQALLGTPARGRPSRLELPSKSPRLPPARRLERDGSHLVLVPGGPFLMGSPPNDPHADEKPGHTLTLPGYYLGQVPVTFAQFEAFVRTTGHQAQGPWRKHFNATTRDFPVCDVSLYDALAYADWVGARLPTEAEWEKGARGHAGAVFPWGAEWKPEACNHALVLRARGNLDVYRLARHEGLLRSNVLEAGVSPYGVWDMAGNLLEWTLTLYRPYPIVEGDGRNSRPPLPAGVVADTRYVLRGGAWNIQDPQAFRCAARYWSYPGVSSPTRGFRLAID